MQWHHDTFRPAAPRISGLRMQIEQRPPKGPNFGLVVALFAAAIVVIFIVAIFVLHWDYHKLIPGATNRPEPNSTALHLPATIDRV